MCIINFDPVINRMSIDTVSEDISVLQNLTLISDKAIRVRNILFVFDMRRYDRTIRFSTYLYKFTVLVDYAVTSVALSAPVSSTVMRNFLVEPDVVDGRIKSEDATASYAPYPVKKCPLTVPLLLLKYST